MANLLKMSRKKKDYFFFNILVLPLKAVGQLFLKVGLAPHFTDHFLKEYITSKSNEFKLN